MLLVHQVGSVKIGEVVRYTITYVPSQDRILPSPEKLFLRIRNTSALVLRGAFVHGPYTLSVAAYPSTFDPNAKFLNPRRHGVPEFEPMVKAASSWECELIVPDTIRQEAGVGSRTHLGKGPEHDGESVSWVVEVASQVIFSGSAAVGFELVLARDKKSLDLSSAASAPRGAQPGKVSDHQAVAEARPGHSDHHRNCQQDQAQPRPNLHVQTASHHAPQPKGVYSRAIRLKVEDTAALWNKPPLPQWQDVDRCQTAVSASDMCKKCPAKNDSGSDAPRQKQKKVHLVVLSHGLHSNLGADMLFMKESIDAAVRKAKVDAKIRRRREKAEKKRKAGSAKSSEAASDQGSGVSSEEDPAGEVKDAEIDPSRQERSTDSGENGAEEVEEEEEEEEEEDDDDDDDDDEQVIVRGFSGNAMRTERGIKYLGKRLARYVLSMTYPDQPYLPPSSKASWASLWTDGAAPQTKENGEADTPGNGMVDNLVRPFKITSISFIAHSLGGLIQTYAIAYCQKHSPEIFNIIKPINFITLATPFLGLGNENPLYVKFALDSGLVGRTGQDLGLTWRAPTLARSGFDALMDMAQKKVKGDDPESKPLLRILPTGPAHTALKKFRNRTVYGNVVNDGIVPLRTSCLLFLDWQGLGRVDKARRDAGLVGTAISLGWAELTGTNHQTTRRGELPPDDAGEEEESGATTPLQENSHIVPLPTEEAMLEDDRQSLMAVAISAPLRDGSDQANDDSGTGAFGAFFSNLFRSSDGSKSPTAGRAKSPGLASPQGAPSAKQKLIYRRSQTIKSESSGSVISSARSRVTSGSEFDDETDGNVSAPPRTTLFESAHDLINPVIPELQYLLDPAKRPRTIFHDRVYHPEDIPLAPVKRRPTTGLMRRRTSPKLGVTPPPSPHPKGSQEDSPPPKPDASPESSEKGTDGGQQSSMRVEEKIARAYHANLSWRKVLVKLEPDAHNNIVVRRMFANAFGWPVIHHLVDAHFSDSAAANIPDAVETSAERAPAPEATTPAPTPALEQGQENAGGEAEAADSVPDMRLRGKAAEGPDPRKFVARMDSVTWSERDWVDSENDSDEGSGQKGWNWTEKIVGKGPKGKGPKGKVKAEDGPPDQVKVK
ncbi:related to ROG1 Protein with putative serine active lipase domain [Cephalotrichum gorgonifer]|uniref:Related to ROG1 Protein with putative serine active lipase domain n=1 Tax=Cephalotrichum gorgonifer TaxID=2041049 RepID=A0AAE8N6R4_9PEZI|nr:related to ROG1 Protein with putative serine active lipase domain [Cephalotrichum gorgonifer]